MTDLQLSLLALGALIIAAVVFFNWWQERGFRNEASKHLDTPQHDVLMDDFRVNADTVLPNEKAAATFEDHPFYADNKDEAFPRYEDNLNIASDVAGFEPATTEATMDVGTTKWQTLSTDADAPTIDADLVEEAGLAGVQMSSAFEPHTEPEISAPASAHHDESQDALPTDVSHQIDLTALLYLPRPTRGADLRKFLLMLPNIDKPIYAYGLTLNDVWHTLTKEQEEVDFKKAAYTLQLADRTGPVSKETLLRFQQTVDEIGLTLNAQVEWQGSPDPLGYAQELDKFCLDVDKMINVHLIQGASGPFTGTKFRGLAEANGLRLDNDGAFHYVDELGHALFSLVNHDNNPFGLEMLRTVVLRCVTFQLDIPRVKNSTEVFNQMILIAKKMEASLASNLVDDNQRPLGEIQIEKIRQQLKIIHAQMVARGVVPGSPFALRLFA